MAKTKTQTKAQLLITIATLEANASASTPDVANPDGTLYRGMITHVGSEHVMMRVNNGHNFTLNIGLAPSQILAINKGDRVQVRGFQWESQGHDRSFQNLNGRMERKEDGWYVSYPKIAVGNTVIVPTTEEAEPRLIKNASHTADEQVVV